jgi:hypothetical protein
VTNQRDSLRRAREMRCTLHGRQCYRFGWTCSLRVLLLLLLQRDVSRFRCEPGQVFLGSPSSSAFLRLPSCGVDLDLVACWLNGSERILSVVNVVVCGWVW